MRLKILKMLRIASLSSEFTGSYIKNCSYLPVTQIKLYVYIETAKNPWKVINFNFGKWIKHNLENNAYRIAIVQYYTVSPASKAESTDGLNWIQ